MANNNNLPLSGIKVLDLSKVLAGPLCAQYLADMGASVIKVEVPGSGDDTRGWPPFRQQGLGAVFMSANRGKRSVAIDLKTPEGRAIVHKLAKEADIAIESFGYGVAERLQIDAATLQKINPRLIHCSISGFGRSGPMKTAPGYDVILQAFSGIMSLTGEEGGAHIRSPISPVDQSTGMHGLSGILAALYSRERTGRGEAIEVSLFETALALLSYNIQSFWEKGKEPERCGSSHEGLCPYQVFEAADGAVMIGVANDSLWQRFCSVADLQSVAEDPRFLTNAGRVEHRPEVIGLVAEAVRKKSVAHWVDALTAVKVPAAALNSLAEVLDNPQTEASGMVLEYEKPGVGKLKGIAHPVRFVGSSRKNSGPPPLLGQDSQDILRELGLSEEEITQLRADGVVG